MGLVKLKVWAVVDRYGHMSSISKEFPVLKEEEYSIPMTLTLGHTWREGFDAWMATVKDSIKSYL